MTLQIELPSNHPGFADPEYRQRRNEIATLAEQWRPGQPLPRAPYSAAEHEVWREVWGELSVAHAARVCTPLLECERLVQLSHERIPQLDEVQARLTEATAFGLAPVAGLVDARRFLSNLAEGRFLSTQYVRHASRPRYTPEPDVIHELVGHAAALCHPGVARLSRRFGQVALELDEAGLCRLERVYWFTLEFGLCEQAGEVRAVGAGLLSSVKELRGMTDGPALCRWDLDTIATTPYDTSRMQEQLFVAPSFDAMISDLEGWLDAQREQARGGRVVTRQQKSA